MMVFPIISVLTSDALRDLVPFVQVKNREKHPWRSVNFSKVAGCNASLIETFRLA